MTGLSFGIFVESLVALLMLLTIGYCVTLNRRLQRLRADEEMLRATISELITATEIAERAILGLKATANDCEKDISARLAEAGHVSARLSDQVKAGEGVFQRIAQLTEAARAPAPNQVQTKANAESLARSKSRLRPEAHSGELTVERKNGVPVSTSLVSAAEEASARVQKLRRMTGDQAA